MYIFIDLSIYLIVDIYVSCILLRMLQDHTEKGASTYM